MFEFLSWLLLLYIIYLVIKGLIRNAVHRGIRDYESHREAQKRKQNEVKIDRDKIEDAHYEELKKK